jgi:hypothetical protein
MHIVRQRGSMEFLLDGMTSYGYMFGPDDPATIALSTPDLTLRDSKCTSGDPDRKLKFEKRKNVVARICIQSRQVHSN